MMTKTEINSVRIAGKAINAIYQGGVLVWEAVRSCFGSGYWQKEKPWNMGSSWKM